MKGIFSYFEDNLYRVYENLFIFTYQKSEVKNENARIIIKKCIKEDKLKGCDSVYNAIRASGYYLR